jgi:hypothetical protein
LSELERMSDVWSEEPVGATATAVGSTFSASAAPAPFGRDRWLRRSLALAWILFFTMGGLAVASTWDRLVRGLVQAPVPASTSATGAGDVSAADRAAAEARRLLEVGRPKEALAELANIKPVEPVYPFALQLREEARRALERGGSKSR